MGFAENFIGGFQAGQQSRRQREQDERDQEERSLRQMLLKDQLNRLKTQDKVAEYKTKYGAADAQFNAQQGQPAVSFQTTIPEAGAGAIPGAPALSQGAQRETVPGSPKPIQYPGYDGGDGFSRQPQTMEEMLKRQAQVKISEAMSTPYNLPAGAVRKVGDTTIGENPKEVVPPSLQSVNRSVGGKPTTLNFNPKTGAYTDQSGQPVSGVAPIPPASVQAGNQPMPTIAPDTPKFRLAQDLAYGKLTMQQFRGLYSYSRDPNQKISIYEKARELNPDFDPARFEAGYKQFVNPQNQQRLVAIDSLLPLLDKAKELSAQVPRGDVQAFNRLLMGAKLQFSNRRVATLKQLSTLVGDEAGLALGVGQASDLKTKLGLSMSNENLGTGAFADTLDQLGDTLKGRKGNLLGIMGPYGEQQPGGGGGGPRSGEERTINGQRATWDGHGWVPK